MKMSFEVITVVGLHGFREPSHRAYILIPPAAFPIGLLDHLCRNDNLHALDSFFLNSSNSESMSLKTFRLHQFSLGDFQLGAFYLRRLGKHSPMSDRIGGLIFSVLSTSGPLVVIPCILARSQAKALYTSGWITR